MKKKYILSPQYEFIKKEEIEDLDIPEVQQLLKEELFALMDTQSGSVLLLSPTIHELLCFFSQPIDFQQVVTNYAAQMNETCEDIERILAPFCTDMYNRNIIVPESWGQEITQILTVGDVFGRYVVSKILSDEGTLKVCIATDLVENDTVVLKILDRRTMPDKQELKYWLKRFKQEINIMRAAQGHPSVCRLLEVIETADYHVSVMECIEGDSLRHWLKNHEPLEYETRIRLFHQILAVYAHLHQKKILHGDIHRSNILITHAGEVKIIDFDMAYHQPLKRGELVIEGGVSSYLPPEKISDNYFDLVTDRADFVSEVYQLGVIGYFIFYEKLPFEGHTWLALAKTIREAPAQLGNYKNMDVFLAKALDKNPINRFQSAKEMFEKFGLLESIKKLGRFQI